MDTFGLGRLRCAWTAIGLLVGALAACGGGGNSDNSGNGNGGVYGGMANANSYAVTPLVSDTSGAPHTDANLINGWGVAFNPQGFVWVANNGTSTATLYDGNGVPQTLIVATPPSPTGIVFNGANDFVVSQGGVSGASPFIFATEGGALAGWSPGVNGTAAIAVFDGSAQSKVYKGLAIAQQGGANFLYATDFHNGRVDVFDHTFAPTTAAGGFTDPNLPAGYAPFGIQAIGNLIYVAYAKQDASAHDEVAGAGLGVVDVYDSAGTLVKRLASGGPLNAPWGLAMAPAGFGTFSNALLVANFGDGWINAFDPNSGQWLGSLKQSDGTPIAIDGLWGIAFGNGLNSQPATTLFYAAGPRGEAHGVYGRIDLH